MAHVFAIDNDTWAAALLHSSVAADTLVKYQQWARQARALLDSITNLPEAHVIIELQRELQQVRTDLETTMVTLAQREQTILNLATGITPGGQPGPRPTTIPLPEAYGGDKKSYLDFKTKLQNKFRADARTFRDEQHKLSVGAALLKDGAADILRPYLTTTGVDLTDTDEFWRILDQAFDDPDRKGTAERTLRALRQGTNEFAVYWAEFLRLKADVDWNDGACMAQLRVGAADNIRQAAVTWSGEDPTTLEGLANLFNKLDLRLRQYRSDKPSSTTTTTSSSSRRSLPAPVVPASQRTTNNPAWGGPAPMDLSANARRTAQVAARAAKRQRCLQQGLCLTCESGDHVRANCPIQAR